MLHSQPLRRTIFKKVHELSHPDIRSTIKLIIDRNFWTSMTSNIREWTRACHQCQLNKIRRHSKTPIGRFVSPNRRFEHVPLDTVGSLCSLFVALLKCVERKRELVHK